MHRVQLSGQVTKIKLLKPDPALALVQLEDSAGKTHTVLVAHQALTFLMEVQIGNKLSCYGHYNQRHQIIMDGYWTNHHAPLTDALPKHLSYPHQKPIQE